MKGITSSTRGVHLALIDATAENDRTRIAPAHHGAPHPALSDRPPSQSSSGAERPRRSLTEIRFAAEAAKRAAATLCRDVDTGHITLLETYPAAAVTAAASAAFDGLAALKRDFFGRGDSRNIVPG